MKSFSYQGHGGILDLDSERAQLEYAIERLDATQAPELVQRMRDRLNELKRQANLQAHW